MTNDDPMDLASALEVARLLRKKNERLETRNAQHWPRCRKLILRIARYKRAYESTIREAQRQSARADLAEAEVRALKAHLRTVGGALGLYVRD